MFKTLWVHIVMGFETLPSSRTNKFSIPAIFIGGSHVALTSVSCLGSIGTKALYTHFMNS